MKLSSIFVFAATIVDARPPEKQLQHLKKASQQIFQHYIVSPIPDINNPAHANGWLTSEKRRNNRAGKMENQYGRLNDIIDSALELGCYPTAEQRVAVDPRFVKNNFKKAMIQLTRNYLKMEGSMDQSKTSKKNDDGSKNNDFSPQCYAKKLAMKRKTDRFYSRARKQYCKIVANEDWCAKNPDYTLPDRVKNNPNGPKNN